MTESKPATEAKVNEDVPDVGAALTAVFEQKNADGTPRWKLDDFHATFPPLLLSLMAHTPFLEMSPDQQELSIMAMGQVGLDVDATDEQIAATITDYVTKHPPNAALAAAIQNVLIKAFEKNDARLQDASRKLGGESAADAAARAPKLGAKAPEGSLTGADLARQMQKKIPMR